MMFACIHTEKINSKPEYFLNAVCVWNSRPHIVNRKLLGAKILCTCHLLQPLSFQNIIEHVGNVHCDPGINETELKNVFLHHFQSTVSECSVNSCSLCEENRIELKCLIPKNQEKKCFEVVVWDKKSCAVLFLNLFGATSPLMDFSYYLTLKDNEIQLFVDLKTTSDINQNWLKRNLLRKLVKWAENYDFMNNNNISTSLRLISIDSYSELYNLLKEKYGKSIVKIWPEVTDPLKFVYEDIAIATYLITLWSRQGRSQRFVDIGCGNGLLTHILSSEGYEGHGIDIRARKIWSHFPSTTKLKVEAITPSDSSIYPDADWLIGNHSDELTPWIPVMAARSSYTCNFFLLPCCAFSFKGVKYQRKNSTKSQYSDYMDYIKFVCDKCGFFTESDKLRIPSTKRCCFVSKGRAYPVSQQEDNCKNIQRFINQECDVTCDIKKCGSVSETKRVKWSEDFVPRKNEEEVKNCTKINKTVVSNIVKIITEELIRKQFSFKEDSFSAWETNYETEIGDLVKLIPKEALLELKRECGGLQTLLKNHHNIFLVQSGKIKFRKPEIREKPVNWKQKSCWFYHSHPLSCPLKDNECSYQH